jgi:hypothetical protein
LFNVLDAAAVPAPGVHGSEEFQLKVGLTRMLDVVPSLFNIEVEDINMLPTDKRAALTEALREYFTALARVRASKVSGAASEELGTATKKVNGLVKQYRGLILAAVKSPDLAAALAPAPTKPRTYEFSGQRFAELFALRLGDIDALPNDRRPAVVEPLETMVLTHAAYAGSSYNQLARGEVEYGKSYVYEMRNVSRTLEGALRDAGLLPKPMADLMRKAGYRQVRDMVLLERNITAAAVAQATAGKDAEAAQLYAAMEAYVVSRSPSGAESKEFDKHSHALGLIA